jgi:epoxyqueuosine reductase QueG
MNLITELKQLTKRHQIEHFGIASLTGAGEFIVRQGGDIVSDYPFSISVGIILPHAVVDLLPRRSEKPVRISYRHHAYDVINLRLDNLISTLSSCLQKSGYRSFPIPASKQTDDEGLSATFSHKLGAHLAGLGWIGKSCLLVTPRDGPRVRWATILTDAPLATTGTSMEQRCGSCSACVEICPVSALSGRAFRPTEPRIARFDAKRCDDYFESMRDSLPPPVCGLCLFVCPYGNHGRKEKNMSDQGCVRG